MAREDGLPLRALGLLSSAMFVSQTAEFLPGGLLPLISSDFQRDLPTVGHLVTAFAATVVLVTVPLSSLTRSAQRKPLALSALVAVGVAGLGAALAPTFEMLMASRVLAGAAHGLFWVVAATYTSQLVPHHLLGRAMAFTAAGGSLASILGIPAGNALGQLVGWRAAFLAVAVLGLVIAAAAAVWLPAVQRPQTAGGGLSHMGWDRSMPGVLLVCVVLLVIVAGAGSFSTFIVPWLQDVMGIPPSFVPAYLLVSALCGSLGLAATGAVFDRRPRGAFVTAGLLATAALAAFGALGRAPSIGGLAAAALVWSASIACLPTLLQIRVMKTASVRARGLAAALQTTAINVAIGTGAVAGGAGLRAVGIDSLPWVAMVMLGGGVGLLAARDALRRPRDLVPERGAGSALREGRKPGTNRASLT